MGDPLHQPDPLRFYVRCEWGDGLSQSELKKITAGVGWHLSPLLVLNEWSMDLMRAGFRCRIMSKMFVCVVYLYLLTHW